MGNKSNKKQKRCKNRVYQKNAQHLNKVVGTKRALNLSQPSQTTEEVDDARPVLTELTNVIFSTEQTNDLSMPSGSRTDGNLKLSDDEDSTPVERSNNSQRQIYCNPKRLKTVPILQEGRADNRSMDNSVAEEGADERRIVDLKYFFENLKRISNHCPPLGCTLANLSICSEIKIGLTSKLKLNCNMCNENFYLNTSNPKPKKNLDINTSAVTGITSAGIGFSQFQELFAAMNLPTMSQRLYGKCNASICEEWCRTATNTMEAAAERERQAAIDEGSVKNGIAVIHVIVDGCWSKRSYRNNYSALSGAAAIVGRKFGEVLYLGIKNKYCCICTRAENKGIDPKEHICYKNYSGSSTSMESEILVEGFTSSIDMYNIIYGRMIADGDSSTYSKILEARPYANVTVEKIECRNHLLRNMCNKLTVITKETKYPLALRKIVTTQRILGIRKAICLAIKYHSTDTGDLQPKISALYTDISNAYHHAFGDHENCKHYYCQSNKISENLVPKFKFSNFWSKIQHIVGVVASNSRSLVHNVDSNKVEQLNSLIAKFVGGKRINYSQRQTYQARCAAAVVSYNTKRPVYTLQKSLLRQSPKSKSKILEEKRIRKNILNKRYVGRRVNFEKKATSAKDKDYGDNCQRPDLPLSDLDNLKKTFLQNLQKSDEEREYIQKSTILQRDCSEWLELRRQLLTASNFGKIINRRSTTSASIIKSLLYKSSISHVTAIKHGIDNEKTALDQLSIQESVTIEHCGLFIDHGIPYLGATPDGLIGDDTIVEIKCPLSAYKSSIEEAVRLKKIRFLTMIGEDMVINKRHPWYFQVQGQLHITRRNLCLFAIWTGENKLIKVEKIYRDDGFWLTQMVEKLKFFYTDHILPELVDPRHTRNMPNREPIISEANKKRKRNEQRD